MTDRSASAQPSSERTDNEISGSSRIGGNAYQARTIHFGGRSVGLTLVSLALVAALTVVVIVVTRGGGEQRHPAAASTPTTAVVTPPTTASSVTPTPAPTPSQAAPSAAASAAAGSQPRDAPAPKPTTGSVPFAGPNLYCGNWRSAKQSANLKVASCVQVNPSASSATFGVMVKNVGRTQVVARALVQTVGLGAPECPQGRYSPTNLRIDPGGIWFSDLARCAVGGLNGKDFQAVGFAIEDPDGTGDIQQGAAVYSVHPSLKDGQLKCKINEVWTSCAPAAYPPND
ncbi:hypothetical protein [Streptomyces sp. NPDC049555]|uniref:hypothetical protein n=1 Tax=Streptomyces sp. NPDC049555 TaxID=3154930 RepID=UPI0034171917